MTHWTYFTYIGTSYGICTGLCILVVITLKFLPLRPYYYLMESILGIHLPRKKPKPSPIVNNDEITERDYPTIEEYDLSVPGEVFSSKKQHLAFFVLLTSVLSLFLIIVFYSLFLWVGYVYPQGQCPNRMADCFFFTRAYVIEPIFTYNCTPGSVVDIPDGGLLVCFAWIWIDINLEPILTAFGSCGGLLSIFGGIMPFVYNLSLTECCNKYNYVSGVLIAATIIALFIVLRVLEMQIGILTILVLIVFGVLNIFASVWASLIVHKRLSKTKIRPEPHVVHVLPVSKPRTSESQINQSIIVNVVNERQRSPLSCPMVPIPD